MKEKKKKNQSIFSFPFLFLLSVPLSFRKTKIIQLEFDLSHFCNYIYEKKASKNNNQKTNNNKQTNNKIRQAVCSGLVVP